MRSINSLKGIITSVIANFTNMVLGFVIQKLIVQVLGIEYAGLNSVFVNIISMLSVAELGIGVAIASHLYEPIKNNDREKIKSLLRLYRNCFIVIGFVVLFIGIVAIPFLKYIIGETTIQNVIILYLIYVSNTVFSYWLMYKRSILQATQKSYIINIIHLIIVVLMRAIEAYTLVVLKNYMMFLITMVAFTVIENAIISAVANKVYPYIKEKNVEKLDNETLSDIFKKVKALFLHKVGGFVVNGTDNLIITKLLGLVVTGIYSNYTLITSSLNALFNQGFSSIAGSLGDLIVEKDKEKNYQTYKNLLFFNCWTFIFLVSAYFALINPFIKLWVGQEYLLNNYIVIILLCNFYIQGVRNTINLFKDTAGIFYEDRLMPIIEVITNLIISIALAKWIGLAGVILGTIISSLIVIVYGHAKYVYTPLFNKNRLSFVKEHLKYILLAIVDISITYGVVSLIRVDNVILQLLINAVIAVSIPNIINLIVLRKTEEYSYYKSFIFRLIGKFKKNKF